jgi:hypothetical protein
MRNFAELSCEETKLVVGGEKAPPGVHLPKFVAEIVHGLIELFRGQRPTDPATK